MDYPAARTSSGSPAPSRSRSSPTREDVPDYAEEVKATLDLVAQDQIAIYPVDVRGVVVADWKATAGDPGGAADSGGQYSARNVGSPSVAGRAPPRN